MNSEQLRKGNEIQKKIEECNQKLDRYNVLDKSKAICIYVTDMNTTGSSIYLQGDNKNAAIKAIIDIEQDKVIDYLLEFQKL